jgi:tol-pal system protein YbgF
VEGNIYRCGAGDGKAACRSALLVFLVFLPVVCSTGCAPRADLLRMEDESARLRRELAAQREASQASEEAFARSLKLLEARVGVLAEEQVAGRSSSDQETRQLAAFGRRVEEIETRLSRLDQKVDLLARTIEERLPAGAGASPEAGLPQGGDAASSSPVAGSPPEDLYRAALADHRRGNYEMAIAGFQAFLQANPQAAAAAEAQYWLAESYYATGDFEKAIKAYDRVIQAYPQSEHVRSAYLKKGYAYMESNQMALGVVQLYHIIDNFPGTPEANLALQRLEKMGLRRP